MLLTILMLIPELIILSQQMKGDEVLSSYLRRFNLLIPFFKNIFSACSLPRALHSAGAVSPASRTGLGSSLLPQTLLGSGARSCLHSSRKLNATTLLSLGT